MVLVDCIWNGIKGPGESSVGTQRRGKEILTVWLTLLLKPFCKVPALAVDDPSCGIFSILLLPVIYPSLVPKNVFQRHEFAAVWRKLIKY